MGFEPSVRIPDFLDIMDSLMPAGLHNLHAEGLLSCDSFFLRHLVCRSNI